MTFLLEPKFGPNLDLESDLDLSLTPKSGTMIKSHPFNAPRLAKCPLLAALCHHSSSLRPAEIPQPRLTPHMVSEHNFKFNEFVQKWDHRKICKPHVMYVTLK